MSGISQKEGQQADEKGEGMAPQKGPGLGALLKGEREKMGLSYEQVSQITRLRIHFLEALENEEWHSLPQSVFVKGFIRSYAKALGLEEGHLVDLYESTLTEETAPSTPIIEPKKSRKGLAFILALLLGAVAVTLYLVYLWMGEPFPERAPSQTKEGLVSDIQKGPSKEAESVVLQGEKQDSAKELELKAELSRPKPGIAEIDIPEPLPEEKTPEELPVDEGLIAPSTAEPPTVTDWLVLKGIVKLRTWIKIYIDDKAPKEYILQPGSRPQWKAREGFYILIGNAAGIDFDFNGKKMTDLGRLGQVVSRRLPEGFERQIPED